MFHLISVGLKLSVMVRTSTVTVKEAANAASFRDIYSTIPLYFNSRLKAKVTISSCSGLLEQTTLSVGAKNNKLVENSFTSSLKCVNAFSS